MKYEDFLERVIDDGVEAAKKDYKNNEQKRIGSIEGFESCRGKNYLQLGELLRQAREKTIQVRRENNRDDYWRIRCFELEVEWVCNCVSACFQNQGLQTIITPTARGAMKAASIVGVATK